MKYYKAPDQMGGLDFCECSGSEVYNAQKSCPWCGCGWLWMCTVCKRALTVAVDEVGRGWLLLDGDIVPVTDEAPHLNEIGRIGLSSESWWRNREKWSVS